MKVLYVIDTLEVGGAEKSLLEIARCFTEVEPVFCHIYEGERLKPLYQSSGIRVISLNVPGKYSFVKAVRGLLQVVVEEDPDLIHSTLFRASFVSRIAGTLKRIPVIDSMVNDSYAKFRWKNLSVVGKVKLMMIRYLDRMTAFLVFRFIAVSYAVKEAQCRVLGVSGENVRVIPRGRDPSRYINMSPERVARLSQFFRLDGAENGPCILNVSRLIHRKGQRDLLLAMPAILKEFPEARLFIAGEGPFRTELKRTIHRLGLEKHVLLLGTREDVPELLAFAEVFVSPSYYEGQGGSLLEAMLSGKPIVASDTPVHRETIDPERTGVLFPPGDFEAMARSIVRLLRHPNEAQELGNRARQEALARFSANQAANQHQVFYKEIIDSWRPRGEKKEKLQI